MLKKERLEDLALSITKLRNSNINWKSSNRITTYISVIRDLLEETESPFCEEIGMAIMPENLKLPDAKYDGKGDLAEHLEIYKSWMKLNSAKNAFKCHAFVITCTGVA